MLTRSEITIMSKCHLHNGEWNVKHEGGIHYVLGDARHILPWSECYAVERSGKSSLHEYATTPSTWPCDTTPVVPLMEARPGRRMEHDTTFDQMRVTRPLTDAEASFVDQYRYRATLSSLASLFGVNPEVIRQYCRRRRIAAGAGSATMHFLDLFVKWKAHQQ